MISLTSPGAYSVPAKDRSDLIMFRLGSRQFIGAIECAQRSDFALYRRPAESTKGNQHEQFRDQADRQGVVESQNAGRRTRSPHRPNPLGLHDVKVTAVEGGLVRVQGLEAIDGTPIVDLKPVLSADIAHR